MIQVFALLLALVIIVYLVKRRYALYQAMAVGILILVVSMGKPPLTVFNLLGQAFIKWTTIELVLAVGLISLLSRLLKDLGLLENFMNALVAFVRSAKLALIIIPALIGLFPVIGGAIFSAPLVDSLGDRLRLSPMLKTSINLIFRHAVFYVSPFNPSLILLAGITGIDILEIIKYLIPLALTNFVAGYYLYLHRTEDAGTFEPEETVALSPASPLKMLLFYGAPLFLSLILFIFFRVPLLVSLIVGVVAALLLGDRQRGDFKDIFLKGPDPKLMLGIGGIMVFQSLVGELAGLFSMMETFAASGIPNFFLFVLVPFFIGWVSASFSLTVGITAPVLFPLLQGGGEVFYAVLLYASGFFSYYISPIHLCQIVSNNYFKVKGFAAYRIQYPVLFITFILSLVIFGFGAYIF